MREIIVNIGAFGVTLWIIGNFLWMTVLHGISYVTGIPWLDIEEKIGVFSYGGTSAKEMNENLYKKYPDKTRGDYEKNIFEARIEERHKWNERR